jgi:hypothetical protein
MSLTGVKPSGCNAKGRVAGAGEEGPAPLPPLPPAPSSPAPYPWQYTRRVLPLLDTLDLDEIFHVGRF